MEFEKITQYINVKLRNLFEYKEKYYLNIDRENNRIEIKTLFNLSNNNLFQLLLSDNTKAVRLTNDLLQIITQTDANIIDIHVSIKIYDSKPIGFDVVSIRNPDLINLLPILPDEMLSKILSILDPKDIKNFGISSKKYMELINQQQLWILKCNDEFNLTESRLKLISDFIRENINYKHLYKEYSNTDIMQPESKASSIRIEHILCLIKLKMYNERVLGLYVKNIVHDETDISPSVRLILVQIKESYGDKIFKAYNSNLIKKIINSSE